MSLHGYVSTDFDIKSPAGVFFETCIEILNLPRENAKKTIEVVPLEHKTISFSIEGIQISEMFESFKVKFGNEVATWPNLDGYKNLEGIITAAYVKHVETNGHNRGILSIKYEKINSDIEDPQSVLKTFLDFVTVVDEYVLEFK